MLRSFSLLLTIVLAAIAGSVQAAPAESRPNIVIILADDLGFSDLGCYGSEIQTPHLDRLAAEGQRYSQFYNCALCGPSRSALMTGLHPHQVGITSWTGLLNDRCVTMFELLKQAGYATCAVGRLDMVTADPWHNPQNIARYVDRFFGTTGHRGPGNYFDDVRNTEFYDNGQPYSIPDGGYKTDLFTDAAVEFIEQADAERPFLLYIAHAAPHWPLHALPEDIAKYRQLYRELGWDRAREQRMERPLASGLLPPGTKLAPRDPRAVPWEEVEAKDWEAERMAVFAAQVDRLDQNVGRVLTALRERGIDQQTLIFFLSDNGASDRAVGTLDKPGETWRSDGTPTRVGNRPDIWPGPADTFVTAGPAWACLSNTPFREHKSSNAEGGIASPLIAWWPRTIAAGGICHELSHITDITATVLDVAGAEYPSQFHGREVTPLAGKSLLPVLRGESRAGHESLCWSISGWKAVRQGQWKLVAAKGGAWQLFDLSRDRTELEDLAEEQPERVRSMAKIFAQWQAQ